MQAAVAVGITLGKYVVGKAISWGKDAAAVYGPQKGVQAIASVVEKTIPVPYIGRGLGLGIGYLGVGRMLSPVSTTIGGVSLAAAKFFYKPSEREQINHKYLGLYKEQHQPKVVEEKIENVEENIVVEKKKDKPVRVAIAN